MKRTLDELREYTLSLVDDIEFTWHGIHGLIIPFNRQKFTLCFGPDDPGMDFGNVDKMLNEPYLDGHPLAEVCEELVFLR